MNTAHTGMEGNNFGLSQSILSGRTVRSDSNSQPMSHVSPFFLSCCFVSRKEFAAVERFFPCPSRLKSSLALSLHERSEAEGEAQGPSFFRTQACRSLAHKRRVMGSFGDQLYDRDRSSLPPVKVKVKAEQAFPSRGRAQSKSFSDVFR